MPDMVVRGFISITPEKPHDRSVKGGAGGAGEGENTAPLPQAKEGPR